MISSTTLYRVKIGSERAVEKGFSYLPRYSGPNSKSIEKRMGEFVCMLLLPICCHEFIGK